MYLYILHRTDYGSSSESSPWVGWLVIFRNGTESNWTMDCEALTKQPLCEMYKYIFNNILNMCRYASWLKQADCKSAPTG